MSSWECLQGAMARMGRGWKVGLVTEPFTSVAALGDNDKGAASAAMPRMPSAMQS